MVIDGRELTLMGCVPWLFRPLCLLPPFSCLPHLHSFHLLFHRFGLCRLLRVFLVLLLVLARLVASIGQLSLTNGCVGAYMATTRCLIVGAGTRWHGFVLVDGGGVVDGGCSQKEVMWQCVTHSYPCLGCYRPWATFVGIYFPSVSYLTKLL